MSTITVRLDDTVDQALRSLMNATSADQSTAVRNAILIAERIRVESELRAEAEALAANPKDRDAIREVREALGLISAW